MLQKHKKIFEFQWKQFQVLFYFIDRDIIKLYFKMLLWISQKGSQFLIKSKLFKNRLKKYFLYKLVCRNIFSVYFSCY